MNERQAYTDFLKQQGRLNEEAALQQISGDAVLLDDLQIEGLRGGRFPTFDISSSTELASVKSHISQAGGISAQDLRAYRADFDAMLGWDRNYDQGLSPMEQDARRVMALSENGVPLPSQLQGADQDEVLSYLQHDTTLRIPDDHIQAVRESLQPDIIARPENYFLPENPSDEQIQSVLDRIRGTGLTSAQTYERLGVKPQAEVQNLAESGAPELSEDESYDYGLGY